MQLYVNSKVYRFHHRARGLLEAEYEPTRMVDMISWTCMLLNLLNTTQYLPVSFIYGCDK